MVAKGKHRRPRHAAQTPPPVRFVRHRSCSRMQGHHTPPHRLEANGPRGPHSQPKGKTGKANNAEN